MMPFEAIVPLRFFHGDTMTCLTQWTSASDLSTGCAGSLPKKARNRDSLATLLYDYIVKLYEIVVMFICSCDLFAGFLVFPTFSFVPAHRQMMTKRRAVSWRGRQLQMKFWLPRIMSESATRNLDRSDFILEIIESFHIFNRILVMLLASPDGKVDAEKAAWRAQKKAARWDIGTPCVSSMGHPSSIHPSIIIHYPPSTLFRWTVEPCKNHTLALLFTVTGKLPWTPSRRTAMIIF